MSTVTVNTRQEQKAASLEKILQVSARRLREDGIQGTGIAALMKEAGLTHGGFYAHFENKDELVKAAFSHAVDTNQPGWFKRDGRQDRSFGARLKRLAKSYLSPVHRDNQASSCAISALVAEAPRASDTFKVHFAEVLDATIDEIAQGDPSQRDAAIVFFSKCVGGLLLSRCAGDEKTSRQILKANREAIKKMADQLS